MAGVFGSHSLVKSLIASADLEIEVLAPKLVHNPNFPGQYTPDWGRATVEDTLAGTLQPAGVKALERAGRIGRVGHHTLFLERKPVVPMQRVRVKNTTGVQYAIVEAFVWPSHVEALVEEEAVAPP